MQVKDELRVLVEAEVARAIENFKKLSGGIDEVENKSKSLGEALDSISKKSLIISGVLGGAGIAAIKFAGENEKLKLSLKNMLGSAEEAASVFEEWRRLGNSPGLSVDEVFSLGKAMVNMGQDTRYATSTMQMLGNIAAGTGVSFGELSGSFERARAMGNLTTRDLIRLQQQGIPIVKQLATELGITEDCVRRLAGEGKISFADLERSFKSMSGPGGQFAGMMDELSGTVLEKFSTATADAKQALASFGEMMLPIATELLTNASSILQGITNMDEGAKRFVLGMAGVVAISGPAIAAIKGIGAAMTLVMANPYMLAIGGVIAAAGLVAGLISKQANAYEDLMRQITKTDAAAKDLLSAYADGNQEKILDEKTTKELIKLYPELNGVIKANAATVREAAAAQEELNKQRIVDSQVGQIKRLEEYQTQLGRILQEIDNLEAGYRRGISMGVNDSQLQENRREHARAIEYREEFIKKIYEQQERINVILANAGKRHLLSGDIIDIDIPISVTPTITFPPISSPATANLRKTWQQWLGEITKVDPSFFGSSGSRAAELYAQNFTRGLNAQTSIAEALGEQVDIAGVLRSRQSEVQNALVELLSINPAQTTGTFDLASNAVQGLIAQYKKLNEEAQKAELNKTIEDLTKKIGDLGKSEQQLAYEAELARIGLDAQSDAAKELLDAMNEFTVEGTLDNLRREIQGLKVDQYDLARATLVAAGASQAQKDDLEKLIKELEKLRSETQKADFSFKDFFNNLSLQFANISLSSLNNELSQLGEAFAKGEFAAENLTQALTNMAQQILNQLPSMFLQAGLQLIAQGQWAMGLGFIAASGTSAFISGYVNGRTSPKENAHGNVFDANGIVPFAHGGTFTNQIVSNPTYFRYGGKFGVMGEAGPESIMPLRRMANGDLGVAASGNGTKVTVNIINNAGADVRQEESTDGEDNKQIDVIIGQLVNNHISSGKADKAMARFGSRPVGV